MAGACLQGARLLEAEKPLGAVRRCLVGESGVCALLSTAAVQPARH